MTWPRPRKPRRRMIRMRTLLVILLLLAGGAIINIAVASTIAVDGPFPN